MATTDLVLEGGGAKLPGLIGALQSLTAAGYDFHRIAGTSAGDRKSTRLNSSHSHASRMPSSA